MEPLTALIIALWIAGRFTRNAVQDLTWKARGEDPPSYRREQERWERRQAKRAEGPGPGRRLLANAWADACAAGDERRARLAERAAERRRRRFADADLDAAEEEARKINERADWAPTENVFTCGGCQREIGQSQVAGYALSGDPLCRGCRAEPDARPGPQAEERPDQRGTDEPEATSVHLCPHCFARSVYDWDRRDVAIVHEPHCPRYVAAETAEPPQGDTAKPVDEPASPDEPVGTVTDLSQWRAKTAPIAPITREDLMSQSGETTNLSAALDYTSGMSTTCADGAASVETSIATMQAADVSGPAITELQAAQEALNLAQAKFDAAHTALTEQIKVREAYGAAQGAGDKQFVSSD